MRDDLEDVQNTWHAQPTTFFHLAPREMRAAVARTERRQQRIARGVIVAFVGDVVAFTLLLFLFVTNAVEAAGCIWIMLSMGWFARLLSRHLRSAAPTYDETAARPSIDAFRASLASQLGFYKLLLAFGLVLPGVALFVAGILLAQPGAGKAAALTGVVIAAAIANGFRLHLPGARAIQQQLSELDKL